jgi:prenyltransferase beta subunit
MHVSYVLTNLEITITSGIDGGIQRSLINVANTYYSIALLCTCRKPLQPKPSQYEKYARKQ